MAGRKKKFSDDDLLELWNEGLTDTEIAEILGVAMASVYRRRKKLGLPRNPGTHRDARVYRVYDNEFHEFVMEGTAREIAEKLYFSRSNVWWYVKQTKEGKKKKYKIYRVET